MQHCYFKSHNLYDFALAAGELVDFGKGGAALQCIDNYDILNISLPVADNYSAQSLNIIKQIDRLQSYSCFVVGKGSYTDRKIYPSKIYDSPLVTGNTISSISTSLLPSYIYAAPKNIHLISEQSRMVIIDIPEQTIRLGTEQTLVNKAVLILDQYDPNAIPLFIQSPGNSVKRIRPASKEDTANTISFKAIQIGADTL